MNNDEIIYKPIGIIHSPFKTIDGIPIQPAAAEGIQGEVKVNKEYSDGLKSLEEFSHIILIYHFHLTNGYKLKVVPFMDDVEHGLFATRAPGRPNPVGISVVKLKSISDNVIKVENIDVIDETPLLDIKPYISRFDNVNAEKNGWVSKIKNEVGSMKSDKRFK
jgi:tRNA (adenine37-N6)-methyltransferase